LELAEAVYAGRLDAACFCRRRAEQIATRINVPAPFSCSLVPE
jgi:hypothetical protein